MWEGEDSRVTQCALSSQKDTDEEVREFLQNNLNLQGKVSALCVCFCVCVKHQAWNGWPFLKIYF